MRFVILVKFLVLYARKIVVVSRLQTLGGGAAAQVHKENVHDCRADHKERAHCASHFQRRFFCDKLVGKIYESCKKHGEKHDNEVVPKVFPETFRTPYEEKHEQSANANHIGNPHIESDVAFCEHACKNEYARNDCEYVGLTYDDDFFAVDFELAACVSAIKNGVAHLDLHFYVVAVDSAAGAYRDNSCKLGFFFCRAGKNDSACCFLICFDCLDDNLVKQWFYCHIMPPMSSLSLVFSSLSD